MIFVYKTQNQLKMQGQAQIRNSVIGNKFMQMGRGVWGGGDRVVGGNTVSNYTGFLLFFQMSKLYLYQSTFLLLTPLNGTVNTHLPTHI